MDIVRLALAVTNPDLRRELDSALPGLPALLVADACEHPCWRGFLEKLAQAQPHIVVFDITGGAPALDDAVGSIRLAVSASVAALNTSAEPESILRTVRAGAHEYLFPPVRLALRKMIERKLQEIRFAGGARGQGKLLGFLSAKGGCGATSIACLIAAELGRRGLARGRHTLLADLDLDAGVAGLIMKAPGPPSVLDAMESLYRMAPGSWHALVSSGGEGLDVLPAPPIGAPREAFSPPRLRELAGFMRSRYDWAVMDLGRGWNVIAFDLLDCADENFLVFTPEVPALNQTRQLLNLMLQQGVAREKVRLVLNQAHAGMDLTVGEIETIMCLPVFAVVREGHAAEDLLIPAGAMGRQLHELAARAE